MQEQFGYHSDTTDIGPELLPMSPVDYHPGPGSQEDTKYIHYLKDNKITRY